MNLAFNNKSCRQVWSTGKRGVSYFINQQISNNGKSGKRWKYYLNEVVYLEDGTKRFRHKRVSKGFLDSVNGETREKACSLCAWKVGGLNCTEVAQS